MEASEQLQAFTRSVLCDVHVQQLQLDELYAVIRTLKAGEMREDDALERLKPARPWVGPRTMAMAQRVVHHVVGV